MERPRRVHVEPSRAGSEPVRLEFGLRRGRRRGSGSLGGWHRNERIHRLPVFGERSGRHQADCRAGRAIRDHSYFAHPRHGGPDGSMRCGRRGATGIYGRHRSAGRCNGRCGPKWARGLHEISGSECVIGGAYRRLARLLGNPSGNGPAVGRGSRNFARCGSYRSEYHCPARSQFHSARGIRCPAV